MERADTAAAARIEARVFGADAWPRGAFRYLGAVFAAGPPPRGRLWVAEVPGRGVVGYVGVELSLLGGEADLVNLAVEPDHRRRGVGRRLVETAVAYCRDRGVPLIWLRVRAGNRTARRFYRRCGFATTGRFHDYYASPREDAVLMALR
jgi:ribosomal-protein-alanine acetyltransferase